MKYVSGSRPDSTGYNSNALMYSEKSAMLKIPRLFGRLKDVLVRVICIHLPSQFGNQDPGSNDTIQEFCQLNYGVTFPILGKTDVNGDNAEPVFEWLKREKPGVMGLKRIKWNFEKFLVGRDGRVKGRWASTAKPETLEGAILEELRRGEGEKAGL